MRLFLGVDGGQSATVAVIGDETGRVVGHGRGPACRYDGALQKAVDEALVQALDEAVKSVGADGVAFEAACFGLSGGAAAGESRVRELDMERRVRSIVTIKAARYVVTHDAVIALSGALAGEPGIICIAGTGSIVFGRNNAGKTARAGGWGYIFGDEGGGVDLVRSALRACLRQEEGWGPSTVLRQLFLTAAGTPDAPTTTANDLMHRFYTSEYPRERIASFAPLIDQAAASGDAVAQEILKAAAQSLATLAGVVRGQLFQPDQAVSVSYTGGVFRSPLLLARFRMLVELEDGNVLAPPRFGPAAGALIEAYRAAGIAPELKDTVLEKA